MTRLDEIVADLRLSGPHADALACVLLNAQAAFLANQIEGLATVTCAYSAMTFPGRAQEDEPFSREDWGASFTIKGGRE